VVGFAPKSGPSSSSSLGQQRCQQRAPLICQREARRGRIVNQFLNSSIGGDHLSSLLAARAIMRAASIGREGIGFPAPSPTHRYSLNGGPEDDRSSQANRLRLRVRVHYYPFWRVDFEINGKPYWREVRAQTAICAQQATCRVYRSERFEFDLPAAAPSRPSVRHTLQLGTLLGYRPGPVAITD
jgi:hypothetical protein